MSFPTCGVHSVFFYDQGFFQKFLMKEYLSECALFHSWAVLLVNSDFCELS